MVISKNVFQYVYTLVIRSSSIKEFVSEEEVKAGHTSKDLMIFLSSFACIDKWLVHTFTGHLMCKTVAIFKLF